MLSRKIRQFVPVRDLVYDCYAPGGRPSIDPVIFFKLQLVMFFEGIRSERHLMRLVADRLSVRWYIGYDLNEPLPDHSSLMCIRSRYGLDIFRRFFVAIVEQCQQAGLIWERELYFDATHVLANAALDSLAPRFAVELRTALQGHLTTLFPDETVHEEQAARHVADSSPDKVAILESNLDSACPPDPCTPTPLPMQLPEPAALPTG